MKRTQRQLTKDFFDTVADAWFTAAYDPERTYLNFPMGAVRQALTLREMKRLGAGPAVIDLGCGTGQFVVELLRNGYDARGVDVSPNMVAEARRHLATELPHLDAPTRFDVRDVVDLELERRFDVVIAMGVLEYLEEDAPFLRTIRRLLNPDGWAFVECRNRLFNLASANLYTLASAETGDLPNLISQLERIERFSPASAEGADRIHGQVFESLARELTHPTPSPADTSADQPSLTAYPAELRRRQHTPEELADMAADPDVGLDLSHVIYYHFHPYPPRYEPIFPAHFNKLSVLMQPLGDTSVGASMCSAFVAVLRAR